MFNGTLSYVTTFGEVLDFSVSLNDSEHASTRTKKAPCDCAWSAGMLLTAGFESSPWVELGSGASAIVLQHKNATDRVLKIFDNKDAGAITYLKYCLENQGKFNWLPVIYKMEIFANFVIVELEALLEDENPPLEYKFMADELGVMTRFKDDCDTWFNTPRFARNRFLNENPNNCQEYMFDILCMSLETGARIDMHRMNFMRRRNGDMVITDPLYRGKF